MAESKAFVTINIKTDNSEELREMVNEAIHLALQKCGVQAVSHAAVEAPVDTGLLRNSITFAIGGEGAQIQKYRADQVSKRYNRKDDAKGAQMGFGSYVGTAPEDKKGEHTVYIGTNVVYAEKQELQGKKAGFLRGALANNTNEYASIIEDTFKDF